MRILVLSYEFPPVGGGGGHVVQGLCRELARSGHSVHVLTSAFRDLPRHEELEGYRVERLPCVRRRAHYCTVPEAASYVASALRALPRVVREVRPDLLHVHFVFPDGFVPWLRRVEIPWVVTAHGSDVPGYNPDRLQLLHALLTPAWRSVVRSAAAIVCPSESLASLVRRRERRAAVRVIPNAFDASRLFPDPKKERRILVATRVLERKGLQFLMQALQRTALDHEVHVVGDGPYLPRIREMARGARTPVRFWGWIDNRSPQLKQLYESSRIFVLPSESENFPICLLEAMAAGAAIVTTRGTGCAEVVGDAAWLVEPRDPEGLQEALEALTRDEKRCAELGQAARHRVEREFAWDAVAARYLRIFEEQVGGS